MEREEWLENRVHALELRNLELMRQLREANERASTVDMSASRGRNIDPYERGGEVRTRIPNWRAEGAPRPLGDS